MTRKVRTAVLISGRGSNMVALAKAAAVSDYPAEIALVISNRTKAAGLQKAQELGIDTLVINHKKFNSRESFEEALDAALRDANIDLVCCAGFMRILTPWITARWPRKMINIHPSLLPKYKGLNTHERALENGDTVHGCTVHYVTEELDGGAIIAQAEITVNDNDTPDSLAARLIPIEHELFAETLKNVANTMT